MPKIAKPLTALEIKRLETPGLHAVGTVPGLCLRVMPTPSLAKMWTLRIVVGNKRRDLGLDGYPAVILARHWSLRARSVNRSSRARIR